MPPTARVGDRGQTHCANPTSGPTFGADLVGRAPETQLWYKPRQIHQELERNQETNYHLHQRKPTRRRLCVL